MKMDERYVYVFVRQDLPIPLQLVHAGHAIYHITRCVQPDEGTPFMVVIGCPDEAALTRVRAKLHGKQIPHFCWADPDVNAAEFLACATAPLTDAQRVHLKNYRLYSIGRPSSEKEHSTFSREVAGSIPADGSKVPA